MRYANLPPRKGDGGGVGGVIIRSMIQWV